MLIKRITFAFFALCLFLLPLAGQEEATDLDQQGEASSGEKVDVYVIPITEGIGRPNLFILRRGLKEAIENEVEVVILDMDTPGGRVDITIEIMEMLDRFEGTTITYVNDDAISAGSLIAVSTDAIYMAPRGKIGATGIIMAGGQDVPETAKMKLESYINATVRSLNEDAPWRSDIFKAMMESDFQAEIEGELIGDPDEYLTLTAREAVREIGDPPQRLFAEGICESVEDLLDGRFGADNYELKSFEVTYSEKIAKWMSAFAPALLGIGLLLLFFEFKTPGFGVFGIGGIILIAIFFISQHIAGLAGNEVILFFALGIILVLVELFFFPGTLAFALSGLFLIFGSLLWAMIDFWPGEPVRFSPDVLAEPVVNLVFGLTIAVVGAFIFGRFFKGSVFERLLVLEGSAGGSGAVIREERATTLPQPGAEGVAVTDLFPSGRVQIGGKRYEARSALGQIQNGSAIRVKKSSDFGLVVEEVEP